MMDNWVWDTSRLIVQTEITIFLFFHCIFHCNKKSSSSGFSARELANQPSESSF